MAHTSVHCDLVNRLLTVASLRQGMKRQACTVIKSHYEHASTGLDERLSVTVIKWDS